MNAMSHQTMARTGFSLSAFERQVFAGADGAGMNACVACCDRWADGERVGLEWFGRADGRTFDALRTDAARFANLLTARGIRPGDVVAGVLPRGAELLTVILGTWRAGAVYQPISTGCGPAAIEARINHTGMAAARLVVTDTVNREKLDLIDWCPPVLVVTHGATVRLGDGDFMAELVRQSTYFAPVPRTGDDPFLLLTGGRGGSMRPVLPKLRSMVTILTSIQIGIEPRESDTGWDVTDPAWSFGLYFAVIRPLLLGLAATAHENDNLAAAVAVLAARAETARRVTAWHQPEEMLLAA